MTSTPTAEKGFKFGDGEGEVSAIQKVAKLEAYLVSYKDGEGKTQVRVCFKLPGTEETFIIQERISGTNVVTPSHAWFRREFAKALSDSRGAESI